MKQYNVDRNKKVECRLPTSAIPQQISWPYMPCQLKRVFFRTISENRIWPSHFQLLFNFKVRFFVICFTSASVQLNVLTACCPMQKRATAFPLKDKSGSRDLTTSLLPSNRKWNYRPIFDFPVHLYTLS